MELIIGLVLFSSALAIRLVKTHRRIAWVVWVALSSMGLFVLIVRKFSFEEALAVVAVGSGIGFLGPEIWKIICEIGRNRKKAIIRFFKKPKNSAIVLYLVVFVCAMEFQPELLDDLMAIAILVGIYWFLARPKLKKLFGGKKK